MCILKYSDSDTAGLTGRDEKLVNFIKINCHEYLRDKSLSIFTL